jgi:predicted peroxiredoxin
LRENLENKRVKWQKTLDKGKKPLRLVNYFCPTIRYFFNLPTFSKNDDRVLSLQKGAKVKICGSCADARGLKNLPLVKGAELSTMAELTQWVVDSDKALTF